ncbi:HAD family hydrolase [Vibrio sp. T187]|uniref:HAD family hydrolase n=1 Tax=Vibrio TaxID=662 RepID=UPI0010CA0EE1|nr:MULTISPECIES: HAD family hydrolase [Vibrio]MBW3694728.1 HAD family hydrolase [Vibrio sp. T187]
MKQVYLFDWGNTLMVDFPEKSGKMCDWDYVEVMPNARETLQTLSQSHQVYVATSAADSTEAEIRTAFERVGLNEFIDGYFCVANLGIPKNCPEFYQAILRELDVDISKVVMVGDVIEKDIQPALQAGLDSVFLTNGKPPPTLPKPVKVIDSLPELLAIKL